MPLLPAAVRGSWTAPLAAAVLLAGCAPSPSVPASASAPASASPTGAGRVAEGAVSASVASGGEASGAALSGAGRPSAAGTVRASAVLRGWDAARSEAFAEGDAAALRRLYVRGSTAGAADVRVLRAYLDRGLRVEGMRMQVLAVVVLAEGPRRLRLRVTDRLATSAVAVGRRTRVPLPRDAASTRVIELVRDGGSGWKVAGVTE